MKPQTKGVQLSLLLLLAAGCTSSTRLSTISIAPLPSPTRPVHYGVNDGFHVPLPFDVAMHDCAYAGDETIRTPQLTVDGVVAFLAGLPCSTLHALVLIEAPDVALAASIARAAEGMTIVRAIENGNELELPPHDLDVASWVRAQQQMVQAERDAGFTGDILTGGVYALTSDTKSRLQAMVPTCQRLDCILAVHLYDPSDSDLAWLNALGVDIAITETGMPTGCGEGKWQAQADYVANIRAHALQIRRLRYFIVYQRPSGPSCGDLDTFGIEGKPLDALLGTWLQR